MIVKTMFSFPSCGVVYLYWHVHVLVTIKSPITNNDGHSLSRIIM